MGQGYRHGKQCQMQCQTQEQMQEQTPGIRYMIDRRSENVTAEEGDRRTWELTGQLVQIDSSDPGAYEGQIEQWIYEWFTKEIEEKAGALKNQIELVKEK